MVATRLFLLTRAIMQPVVFCWLKYHQIRPSPGMCSRLRVDFIYFGHGIDESNHDCPHSHLWDRLRVVEMPLSPQECRMYIQLMPAHHFRAFMREVPPVRFHAHGRDGQEPQQEIESLRERHAAWKGRIVLRGHLATASLLLLSLCSLWFKGALG